MTPAELEAIMKLLSAGGSGAVIAGLVLIVAGVVRGWWVPGKYYDQAIKERDEAKAGWIEMLQTAHRANLAAEQMKRGRA